MVYPKVSGLSHNEINNTKHRWEATRRVMAPKLSRLTHKIAIQLHSMAERCTLCSSRSRRPVRKLLVTPLYSLDIKYVVSRLTTAQAYHTTLAGMFV